LSHTILIVDDNAVIRRCVRGCLEDTSDWQVCGEAENGKIAVEKVIELRPDIVLLDLQMPVMNGLEAARQITLLAPGTAMVMFTMHTCQDLVSEARAVGIKDVCSKAEGVSVHLVAALNKACNGNGAQQAGNSQLDTLR
jgi:DNA-binding NarL/FixJ family response regulator